MTQQPTPNSTQEWFQLQAKRPDGTFFEFEKLRGHATLIVNVASHCGFTPQYKQLEHLYRTYAPKGFQLLAFPCNQFGGQEPGSNEQIQEFCKLNYDVTFPVLAKIQVNGPDADPIFVYLKKQAPGLLGSESIKWNFTKFLVDGDGNVIERFAPTTSPSSIAQGIERLLANVANGANAS
jgi:glutathione peroxidase